MKTCLANRDRDSENRPSIQPEGSFEKLFRDNCPNFKLGSFVVYPIKDLRYGKEDLSPRTDDQADLVADTRNCIYTEVHCTMPSADRSSSFEQLILPLLPSLYRHAIWLTRNHAEAEDLAQETITKALRAHNSFQTGTNYKAWIFRILRNAYLTSRTGIAASRTVFLEDYPEMLDTADATPTPEDTLIQLNNETALHSALDQLQPPLREILLLCDVEELKYRDIAIVLDLPMGTVMSRISRARVALRQLLQPQLGESV
jgi:RNA polymerase sigma-70 factor (ECF subfamily)